MCFLPLPKTTLLAGDPPNLIIANNLKGVNFVDFIKYVLPGILFSTPAAFGVLYLLFRKQMAKKVVIDYDMVERKCRIRKKETLIKVGLYSLHDLL